MSVFQGLPRTAIQFDLFRRAALSLRSIFGLATGVVPPHDGKNASQIFVSTPHVTLACLCYEADIAISGHCFLEANNHSIIPALRRNSI